MEGLETLSLQSTVISSAAEFANLRGAWEALLHQSDAGLFNSWSWLYPWFRRIGADRSLFLITVKNGGGDLVGVMPLSLEERKVWGVPVRRLAFLGETHVGSDYLDVVAKRGYETQVTWACARVLLEHQAHWDVLDLMDLPSDSLSLDILDEVFRGRPQIRTERFRCPYERFQPGTTFDAFLRKTGRRDNFLRRQKWLQKQPGYDLELTVNPGEVAAPLEQFFRLHAMRWQCDGGSQGIKGPGVEAFHRDACAFLAEDGKLRLFSMKLGGKTLASVYGMSDRGKFYYFQSGYDPAWANRSIGLVLVGETFRYAHENDLSEYDFLRGEEPYKFDWTTQRHTTVGLRILSDTGSGAFLDWEERAGRVLRRWVKHALPEPAVTWVQRARRRRLALH